MDIVLVKTIAAFMLSAFIGAYTIPSIIKIAIRKDLVAKPNHRTSHTGRIPNVGGISIFIAFILSFLLTASISDFPGIRYFLFAIIILFFIGFEDDVLIVSAKRKLYGEIVAILIMVVFGDIRITNLHDFFGVNELPYITSVILTVFITIVIINSLNLIDGIDGLASGVGMLVSVVYGVFFLYAGGKENILFAIMSFTLAGSLLPFFIYNVYSKRNKIFMGDAGALVLGFVIAVLTIRFLEVNILGTPTVKIDNAPIVAICILIVPLFDTIRVFILRILDKKSPFSPDRNHLHHMLIDLGLKHISASYILIGFNVFYILFGFLCRGMPKYLLLSLVIVSAYILSEITKTRVNRKKELLYS